MIIYHTHRLTNLEEVLRNFLFPFHFFVHKRQTQFYSRKMHYFWAINDWKTKCLINHVWSTMDSTWVSKLIIRTQSRGGKLIWLGKQYVCSDWLEEDHSACQQNANQRKQVPYVWSTETATCLSLEINHFPNSLSGQDLNFQPSPCQDQKRRRKKTQLLENDFNNYYF